MTNTNSFQDNIVALATAQGVGAIAVIRVSGKDAITICNSLFKGKNLDEVASHTIHFGSLIENEHVLDEVLVSVFRAPRSFTKENSVEISTHGSPFIVKKVIEAFIRKGCRYAKPGEFTQRAFLNGQFDLAQAEAVADLIHSDNEAMHAVALNQMRGGFSNEIKILRERLIHFASMIELELDFSEEDVEFANRQDLLDLISELHAKIRRLISSFDFGNVIKEGVPVVIAGKPNAGKSTLLNCILNEERAIVSDIAGTTRDVIEDEINIEGIKFRFIDTAGLREAQDVIEAIGVQRTKEKLEKAGLILYLFDVSTTSPEELRNEIELIKSVDKPYILIGNKVDKAKSTFEFEEEIIFISAHQKTNLEKLQETFVAKVMEKNISAGGTIVTNARHYENLLRIDESLEKVVEGVKSQITGDFLAMDIRQALFYLGEITGTITTDDLLDNIFSKFCIGK